MCLYIKSNTAKGRDRDIRQLFGKNDAIICYKKMDLTRDVNNNMNFYSICFTGIAKLTKFFRSHRRSRKLTNRELSSNSVHKGIHVYLDIDNYNPIMQSRYYVKCIGFRQDIVAVGHNNEVVFMKVLPIEYRVDNMWYSLEM